MNLESTEVPESDLAALLASQWSATSALLTRKSISVQCYKCGDWIEGRQQRVKRPECPQCAKERRRANAKRYMRELRQTGH